MRPDAPERLGTVCPICASRDPGATPGSLVLADRFCDLNDRIGAGVLRCTAPHCQAEFPIIDGIPIVRSDARDFLASCQPALRRRDDLPGPMERVLADTVDPGTAEDLDRYYLSVYARDAYPADGSNPRIVGLLDEVLELAGGMPDSCARPGGAALELGCGVGRVVHELVRRGVDRVVGLDVNLALLRCAAGVRDAGSARYAVRHAGVLYEPVAVEFQHAGADRAELWCADALAPPFAPARFGLVVALNVLDCVASPVRLLERAAAMLEPGGRLVLTTPYDWTAGVTPMDAWLGGHSPRSDLGGDPASTLRSLLSPDGAGQRVAGLRLVAERDGLAWSTRLHDRSEIRYGVHAIVAERTDD